MTNELVLGFERPLNRTGSSQDDPEITKKDFSASGEAGEDIFSSPPGFQEMTLHGSGLSAEGDLNFLALAGPHGRDRCKKNPKKTQNKFKSARGPFSSDLVASYLVTHELNVHVLPKVKA